jgi:hypothetical protein
MRAERHGPPRYAPHPRTGGLMLCRARCRGKRSRPSSGSDLEDPLVASGSDRGIEAPALGQHRRATPAAHAAKEYEAKIGERDTPALPLPDGAKRHDGVQSLVRSHRSTTLLVSWARANPPAEGFNVSDTFRSMRAPRHTPCQRCLPPFLVPVGYQRDESLSLWHAPRPAQAPAARGRRQDVGGIRMMR